jgi:hypothetical protein
MTMEAAGIEDLGEGAEKFNRDATLPRTLRKLIKTSSRLVPYSPTPSHLSERAYGNLTATAFSSPRQNCFPNGGARYRGPSR